MEERGEHRVLGNGGRAAEEVEEGQGEEAGGEPGGGAEGMQWLPRRHLRTTRAKHDCLTLKAVRL